MRSKKSKVEREKLIEMSHQAKECQQLILAQTGEKPSINSILLKMHMEASGATTFLKFNEWKEKGFKIKKGETAYRVWGTPKKRQAKEQQEGDSSEKTEKSSEYKFFPMCCLYNELQVENID